MTLRRGFRADAERYALQIREDLDLAPDDPIELESVADDRGIKIVSADMLIDRKRLEELERIQAYAFSACTFDIDGTKVVVTNPLHDKGRQASDLAHELAHDILRHDLSEIRHVESLVFRTCRSDQEEEATAFGGTLLLPRPLLFRAAKKGMRPPEIAEQYGVTLTMARYRFDTTGVMKQLARMAK